MNLFNTTTSCLVYNLALESSLPKTTFSTKIGGGLGEKIGTPISATTEASDFKFGTQHEFGFTLPSTGPK